jgi:acyl transferase domain-containing protein
MLEEGVILPNIHFERPNKRISFEQIVVPTAVMPWPEGVKRRASVNSFGYGGTNAHVIVEAFVAPSQQSRDDDLQSAANYGPMRPPPQRLFVLAGREPSAVQEMHMRYASYVQGVEDMASPNVKFDDLSYTLGSRRSKLDWAVSHVASDFKELRGKLSATEVKATRSSKKARVGFVFTGQGAQWPRMALELMEYTTFRKSIQAADAYLSQQLDCRWSVIEELEQHDDQSRIGTSELGQPLCTIVQVAMVDLLRSWQVHPTAVVGHSSGEIAAAYCTGAITKQAAWQIAFQRGRECASLKTQAPELQGAMLAVGLGAEAVKPYIDCFAPGHINVACINSPNSVTVSGDASEVRELFAKLSADNIFARELQVENAYHSHHMKLVAASYLRSMANVTIEEGAVSTDVRMLSSVTGQLAKPSELTPEYWVQNLVSPVLFTDAVTAMLRGSGKSFRHQRKIEPAVDFLLEIGPHAVLRGPLQEILKSEASPSVAYASMLLRGTDAIKSVMTAAGDLYCHGYPVDITAVNNFQHKCRVLVDLPAYPWNRSHKYWATSRLTQDYLHRVFPHHGLLGERLIGSDGLNPAWRHFLNLQENPWIKDHIVHGAILYPGAGFLAMAVEAALQLAESGREVANVRLQDVRIVKALIIKEDEDEPEVITHFRRADNVSDGGWSGRWMFEISCARGLGEVEQHATGQIMLDYLPKHPYLSPASGLVHESRRGEHAKLADTCVDTMKQGEFYDASKDAGLVYGPDFQGVVAMGRGTDSCCWSIQITDRSTSLPGGFESKHLIHPTTLDAIVHTLFGAMNKGKEFQNAALPVAVDSIILSAGMPASVGTNLSGFTVVREAKKRGIVADIHVSSSDWRQPLVQIEGLRCTQMPSQKVELVSSMARPSPLGSVTYRPDIDLFDEEGLMSYINENQKHASSTESRPELYSERLRNAVAQVRDFLTRFSNDKNLSDSSRRSPNSPCSRTRCQPSSR